MRLMASHSPSEASAFGRRGRASFAMYWSEPTFLKLPKTQFDKTFGNNMTRMVMDVIFLQF